nr:hypothetical protein [uncultured Actinoplanes sp.]
MTKIGAQTDRLRSDKLTQAFQVISVAGHQLERVVKENMPPGRIRCETDQQIHDGLQRSTSTVTGIVKGIVRMSNGDTSNVDSLKTVLTAVEQDNIDAARKARGADKNTHH